MSDFGWLVVGVDVPYGRRKILVSLLLFSYKMRVDSAPDTSLFSVCGTVSGAVVFRGEERSDLTQSAKSLHSLRLEGTREPCVLILLS